jgi:hypothetical protein
VLCCCSIMGAARCIAATCAYTLAQLLCACMHAE